MTLEAIRGWIFTFLQATKAPQLNVINRMKRESAFWESSPNSFETVRESVQATELDSGALKN